MKLVVAALIQLLLSVAVSRSQNNAPVSREQTSADSNAIASDIQFLAVQPRNLITNGAFESKGSFDPYSWDQYDSIQGWQVTTAEIGSGIGYNHKWGYINVAELDIKENVAYHLPLQMVTGNYYIAFDWGPHSAMPLKSCQIALSWNGVLFTTLLPAYDGIFTQSMAFKSSGKKNKLTFMGAGESDGSGATISNVRVYATSSQIKGFTFFTKYYERKNLIRNGDFEYDFSLLRTSKYISSTQLTNWQVSKGEIGRGLYFNSGWDPTTKVVQLDAEANVEYKTQFYAEQTVYLLSFDYAPRMLQTLQTSKLGIYVNGFRFFIFTPKNYHIQRQFMTFNARKAVNNTISFKGEGLSDGFGAAIDNVALYSVINQLTKATIPSTDLELQTTDQRNSQSFEDVSTRETGKELQINQEKGEKQVIEMERSAGGDKQTKESDQKKESSSLNITGKPIYSAVGHNLIENGQFADVGTYLAGKGMYHAKYVTGWEVEVAEVGPGEVFNSKWGKDTNVAQLDVDHNTAYHLPLKLSKGNYYGAFDWAPSQHGSLVTSQIELRWNGNLMTTLLPNYNQVFTQIMTLKSSGNQSILTFLGAGYSDGVGAGITNVRVFAASDALGKFTQVSYDESDFVVLESFEQRSPIRSINLGQLLSEQRSVEFKGHETTYYASFDFVAFFDQPPSQSRFSVTFNSKEVFKFVPEQVRIQHQLLTFEGREGNNTIVFRSEGSEHRYGATISNLQVHPINYESHMTGNQSIKHRRSLLPQSDQSSLRGILLSRVTPNNLLSNGVFEMESLPSKNWKDVSHLQNWQIPTRGQIGLGLTYNWRWGYTVVANLDAQQNTQYTVPLQMSPGVYYTALDLAARARKPLKTCQVKIKWNGQNIISYTPSSEQIFTQQLLFRSEGQRNLLTIAGAGASDGVGATFSNVRVHKVNILPGHITPPQYELLSQESCINYNNYQQNNYLWNGDFEFPPAQQYFTGNQLSNWEVKGQGEIGLGRMYNSDWDPKSYVLELDSKQNAEYTIEYVVTPDYSITHYLSFDFAPCQYYPFATSSFRVKLNGNVLFSIFPKTKQVQHQFAVIIGEKGVNKLTFEGSGDSDGRGAAIDNVEVRKL